MATIIGVGVARADSAKLSGKQPIALFVDVSEEQIPAVKNMDSKRLDLHGFPVLLGTGPTTDVGLMTGRSFELADGLSLETGAAATRTAVAAAVLQGEEGFSEMTAGATAHYTRRGWDVALTPEVGTAGLDAARPPNYTLSGSVAHRGNSGWGLRAASLYRVQNTESAAGTAGVAASGKLGFAHVSLFGAQVDLDYFYAWNRPGRELAALAHGPALLLDFDLARALQCRVSYRYEFAGQVTGDRPAFAWLGQGGQDLAIGWKWDLAAAGIEGMAMGADLAYRQDFFSVAEPAVSTGSFHVAMNF
jgi:hypothetical protein